MAEVEEVPGADPSLERLSADLDGGFASFVRTHADSVYCTALRLSCSPSDAEDIAQETFVRAYRALRRFDAQRIGVLRPRAWLLTITLNLVRNRHRSASRRPRTVAPSHVVERADTGPGPEEAAGASESRATLVRLLAQLSERHRVPVVLHHVVGLSYPEVASVLDCPVGTAKANAARGLARLRDLALVPGPKEEP